MIQIIDKSQCCGCNACVQICPKQCIRMQEDCEGFLYPLVNDDMCVDCKLCEKVCPIINQNEPRRPLKVYAAMHPDEDIRLNSSSGGIFTLLAEQIIDEGGVVFGARFDEYWEVIHDYTETKEGLAVFRGSKYVQSRIGNTYQQAENFLKHGRKVMFTGTPCQIVGLKKFLRKDYPNLFTVEFVCHGVPSPLVWRKYLKETAEDIRAKRAVGKNTVTSSLSDLPVITGISFRDKTNGWKKFGFSLRYTASKAVENSVSVSAITEEGLFLEPFTENHFMRAFLADYILRPSCYACPSKLGKSCSNITIGDLWGVDRFNPSIDDDKGLSLVMLHNDKASAILAKCNLEDVDYLSAFNSNPSIERSVSIPVNRTYFWHLLHKGKSVGDILEMCHSSKAAARLRRYVYRKLKV